MLISAGIFQKKQRVSQSPPIATTQEVSPDSSASQQLPWYFIFTIVIVSFAVYFNALFNGFVYDDTDQIVENP